MPAARYWRAVGLEAHAGGDLELSALHVYDAGGRVDAGATLTSTIAPAAGALANLQDSDFGTTARFAAAAVSAPAFALQWDFGSPVDVYGVRAGGPSAPEFLKLLTLQYSSDGATWGEFAAQLGDFIYPGASALTTTPTSPPWIYSAIGEWTGRGQGFLPSQSWRVAISANGLRLAAAANSGYIFTSDDAGLTWVQRTSAGSLNWLSLDVSDDGLTILAGSAGYLFTSADGGATWTQRTSLGSRNWTGVAVTPDGIKMAATASNFAVYTSVDSGETWVQRMPDGANVREWQTISISADGARLAVAAQAQYIYTSADGGATWTRRFEAAGTRTSPQLAASADGMKIMISDNVAPLYLSVDGGASWVAKAPAMQRIGVAMSGNGLDMIALASNGRVDRSSDGGETWRPDFLPGNMWSVAISADGTKSVIGVNGGFVLARAARDPMFAGPPLRAIEADTPEFFASSPVPDFTTIKLPDVMPWRDMEFAGNGKVTGTVKEKNTPANTPLRRRVRLVREIDGLQIRETWSNASTGAYEFLQIDERHKYSVISYDHLANYRAVIADNLTPELMQ